MEIRLMLTWDEFSALWAWSGLTGLCQLYFLNCQ